MQATPQRLVSLVPSITETLCTFGLQERVVGCTSFCTHPLSLRRTATAVGGTKDARLQDILALEPTHVFVNVEENPPALVLSLQEQAVARGFCVHVSFPRDLAEARDLVSDLARLLGFEAQERAWRAECTLALTALDEAVAASRHQSNGLVQEAPKYAYFIWRDPWMVAGDKTYIARLLARAGFENAFATGDRPEERYPVVDPATPPFNEPGLVLLFSSEPFPFRQRQITEFLGLVGEGHRAAPRALKVDGRLLSWYGSSTLPALRYLAELRERILSP